MNDEQIRKLARRYVRDHGANKAAAALGVSRSTVLGIAADAAVQASTFALVREHLAARAAEEDAQAMKAG